MSSYDANKIEEYQLILMKNPRSKVFAALAETYRKMDLHEEALETAFKGIHHNPDYPSGLVALARILLDLKKFEDAIPHLNQALSIRPENFLALRMLGLCHVELGNIADALNTYKSLLVQNPNDPSAQSFVKKWEFLEAADFDFDHPLVPPSEVASWVESLPGADQLATLVDVFMSKDDMASAAQLIASGLIKWPESKLLLARQRTAGEVRPLEKSTVKLETAFWNNWLQRIEQRKNVDPLSF